MESEKKIEEVEIAEQLPVEGIVIKEEDKAEEMQECKIEKENIDALRFNVSEQIRVVTEMIELRTTQLAFLKTNLIKYKLDLIIKDEELDFLIKLLLGVNVNVESIMADKNKIEDNNKILFEKYDAYYKEIEKDKDVSDKIAEIYDELNIFLKDMNLVLSKFETLTETFIVSIVAPLDNILARIRRNVDSLEAEKIREEADFLLEEPTNITVEEHIEKEQEGEK